MENNLIEFLKDRLRLENQAIESSSLIVDKMYHKGKRHLIEELLNNDETLKKYSNK
jgi:hypothetical protein